MKRTNNYESNDGRLMVKTNISADTNELMYITLLAGSGKLHLSRALVLEAIDILNEIAMQHDIKNDER